ncbi:MAG TPA: TonB-dependent receptor [Sphingobacteriaceae bacterium]
MKRVILLLLFLVSTGLALFAQKNRKVSGIVRDSTGSGIIGANVKLASDADSLVAVTDEYGVFIFRPTGVKFTIIVSSLGFETYRQDFEARENSVNTVLKPIILKAKPKMLREVVVKGTQPITLKKDTVEYNAADFPVPENSVVEDILKILPGLHVDADGNVKAQGEEVLTVRINGLDFFAGDLKALSQQFPAEFVEKIQIIDDFGEEARLTGIKKGKPAKILNIVIPDDKNRGIMGNVHAGAGTNNRYDAGGSLSRFKGARMVSVRGSFDNTTTNSYSVGSRSAGFGDNQLGSSASGITTSGSAGIDFRNKFGDKINYYGHYKYSRRENTSLSSQLIQTVNTLGTIHNELDIGNAGSGEDQSAGANFDYQISKADFIKISATMARSVNTNSGLSSSRQTGLIRQDKVSDNTTTGTAPIVGAGLTFNHRFKKQGRNVYLSLNLNSQTSNDLQDIEDQIRYYVNGMAAKDSLLNRIITSANDRIHSGMNLSYTEPLSKNEMLQFSYSLNRSSSSVNRITNVRNLFGVEVPVDSLSTVNEQRNATHRLNLHYNASKNNFDYGVGFSVMPTGYNAVYFRPDTSVKRNTFSFSPSINFSYNKNGASVSAFYSGESVQPSIHYIQPVREVSNLQNQVVGNPGLRAEFNHSLNIGANKFSAIKRTSFYFNLNGSFSQNKIVSNIILLSDTLNSLKQETHYINSNGFYGVGATYSWSKLSKENKFNITYGGAIRFDNNISYADGLRNAGRNWTVSQTAGLRVSTEKWYNLSPSVTYSYSSNHYSLARSIDTDISSFAVKMNGRLSLFKTFSLGADASKSMNSGYAEGIEANPLLVNAYFSKTFFKRKSATLKVQAYDLFNDGANISRQIMNNSIVDNRTSRLTRYFIASLSVNLNKFGGKRSSGDDQAGN